AEFRLSLGELVHRFLDLRRMHDHGFHVRGDLCRLGERILIGVIVARRVGWTRGSATRVARLWRLVLLLLSLLSAAGLGEGHWLDVGSGLADNSGTLGRNATRVLRAGARILSSCIHATKRRQLAPGRAVSEQRPEAKHGYCHEVCAFEHEPVSFLKMCDLFT